MICKMKIIMLYLKSVENSLISVSFSVVYMLIALVQHRISNNVFSNKMTMVLYCDDMYFLIDNETKTVWLFDNI